MSAQSHIDRLRATAQHLRSVSAMIASSRALTVHGLAGPDTWIGPTAQSCYDELLSIRRQLHANQQSLDESARRLNRQADVLEQQLASSKLVLPT